jgi:hypothetical protein
LRLALPLIDGRGVGILEREILHILRDHADLRRRVRTITRQRTRVDRTFIFGHLEKTF